MSEKLSIGTINPPKTNQTYTTKLLVWCATAKNSLYLTPCPISVVYKNPQLNISSRKYWSINDQVLMRFSSWLIDLWYLILTKANDWGGCKISRVEKSCCQPKSKGHTWFIKCFPILLHTYNCNLNSYLWKGEWKKIAVC